MQPHIPKSSPHSLNNVIPLFNHCFKLFLLLHSVCSPLMKAVIMQRVSPHMMLWPKGLFLFVFSDCPHTSR